MLNSRTLFPALFKPAGGGGGGSGQTIQVTELPESVLAEKDKIYQYIGSTTETLTNGYFYKCVEHTTTEGETITVTYSWENVDVQPSTNYNNKILHKAHYTVPNVQSVISSNTVVVDNNFANDYDAKCVVRVDGYILTASNDDLIHLQVPLSQATDSSRLNALIVVNDEGELRIVFTYSSSGSYVPRYIDLEVYFYESEV